MMKNLIILLGLLSRSITAIAGKNLDLASFAIIGTNKITSKLIINKEKVKAAGRVSFHLETTSRQLAGGKLKVMGF